MSETIDPISLLKDYIQNNKEIKLSSNNELIFDGLSMKLPLDTQTAWARKDGKGHYNLGQLWFLCANKDLKPTDYMR